jgi:hypothetical protein
MKSLKKIFIVSLLSLAFFSCRKAPSDTSYVGTWSSSTTMLEIGSDGYGDYQYYDGLLTKSITGRAKIKNGKLKICSGPICKKYGVDLKPTYIIDGNNYYYKMTLNGEDFVRY